MPNNEPCDTHGDSEGDSAERALLCRIAGRERAAMREFYLLFHRRLGRFLMRLTTRYELAEEIINDSMLVVWQQAGTFRGESRVSTWVMGIAYRQALKTLRGETRAKQRAALFEQETVVCESQAAESSDWLDKALGTLPIEQRLTLELTYYCGYSCEEIATITSTARNTVKTRMFYAREKLRNLLPALAEPLRSP